MIRAILIGVVLAFVLGGFGNDAGKPQKDGEKITSAHAILGLVRKLDTVRDLALIEVENVPAYVAAIPLGGMSEVQVGADVHAIGHPKGQTWTYTKGLISQITGFVEPELFSWFALPTRRQFNDEEQPSTPN